jgi:hypothetical protein
VLELVERHVHAAAIARHEDGDGAAILPIEVAQLAAPASSAAPATVGEG